MESLSSVATIVRIAQDIAGAVATVSRNRNRCRMLAERVQGIGDLLRELHGSGAGTTDAATRRLLDRLEDALLRALELVRSCQDSSCLIKLLAGGCQAERLDEVDGEINHCLLDLGSVAISIALARLEKLQLHQNVVRYRDTGVKDDGDKDDNSKTEKVAAPAESGSDKKEPVPTSGGERKDKDKTAAGAGAGNATIGVPECTVNAGMHELVPPPSYGHWPYAQGFVIDRYYHDGAGAPSGAAAYYHHHHSPYPEVRDMFSDENPNACKAHRTQANPCFIVATLFLPTLLYACIRKLYYFFLFFFFFGFVSGCC